MAYMKGDYYVWASHHGGGLGGEWWVHIWTANGYDGWDISEWATEDTDDHEVRRRRGYEAASGTSLPLHLMDEFVMMRLVEMMHEGLVDGAIDRAVRDKRGAFGGILLEENAERLKAGLRQIQIEGPSERG
jgi:hypothetical protein